MDLPAPIETACEDLTSTFFHLLFSVTPNTPGNDTVSADWKQRTEQSLASYIRTHCEEGVLVQVVLTNTLRLEVAIRFSKQGRDVKFLRDNLGRRTML